MVLKIRLARVAGPGGSKRHAPFYNIVLAQARSARDSKPMEVLGTYDPIPKLSVDAPPGERKHKDIQLDVSRAKYWLGVGAQPTDTAWRLLAMIGLVEPRWLATGEQTENALKAVRFKTNLPEAKQLLRAGAIQTMTTKAANRKGKVTITKGEIPGEATGTTSPQDPNAA